MFAPHAKMLDFRIDPNEARVPVPDRRFDWLVDVFKPASVVPASLAVRRPQSPSLFHSPRPPLLPQSSFAPLDRLEAMKQQATLPIFQRSLVVIAIVVQITDIAGLVKGAASGEGLGNAFLSHIRAVDGIFHVVRIFESGDITHVEGALDPVRYPLRATRARFTFYIFTFFFCIFAFALISTHARHGTGTWRSSRRSCD
jgi:hypothetical protein